MVAEVAQQIGDTDVQKLAKYVEVVEDAARSGSMRRADHFDAEHDGWRVECGRDAAEQSEYAEHDLLGRLMIAHEHADESDGEVGGDVDEQTGF